MRRTATAKDGARIEIRHVEPDDRERLADAYERLSPESRYRRFFAAKPQLSERELDFLTRIDHAHHEAVVALDPRDGRVVGVARYVRTGDGVAEPAMVVADDWQGLGVARLLLDALVERAREDGIARFVAPVLADNRPALRALSRLGETTRTSQGTDVELRIELPATGPPGLAERALGEFARGVLEPARTLLDQLRPRRRGAPDAARRNVIVVGTDGSPPAAAAVAAATALAAASDAIVHVVGAQGLVAGPGAEVADAVRECAAALRERGLHVHEHVRRGDPALALLDVASEEDARLVVVGASGRDGAARRVLGSAADAVAERAPCNVLIAR